jgi:1-acyl-sn-glycerol-3-phosphate acyltransferase
MVDSVVTHRIPVRHSWFPASSCDSSCVPGDGEAGRLRRTWRVAMLLLTAGVAITIGLVMPCLPRTARTLYVRAAAVTLLASIGIRVEVSRDGPRPSHRGGILPGIRDRTPGLVVANHISFLDILAIAAVTPSRFVAKAELTEWPVIGLLTRRLGVIPIRRESLRDLPDVVSTALDGLRSGDNVGLFPEGTTRCGRGGGRFRPALFQAAVDAGVPVQPLVVSFHTADGSLSAAAAFIGNDNIADTMRRVFHAKGLIVRVRVCPPQVPGEDRRELADRCERIVFGDPPQITLTSVVPEALVG